MRLVRQITFNKKSFEYKELDSICFKAKNLYNVGLHRIRQSYKDTKKYLPYKDLYKILAEENQVDYRNLPQNVSSQVLISLERNYKSYFESLKSYNKNPNDFKGLPKPPSYLDKVKGRFVATYTQRMIPKKQFKNGYFTLTGTNLKIKTDLRYEQVNQVQIIPRGDSYIISIIYEVQEKPRIVSDLKCGADLGLNNLITIGFNDPTIHPIIVKGGSVKSINQYYNKKRSKLQEQLSKQKKKTSKRLKRLTKKRNNKIKDKIHKASRLVVDYVVKHNISTLVIGKNKNWKSEINIGKKNNQNFVSVPHDTLFKYIKYKCELVGVEVIDREESYTSKCSFRDLESIRKHETYKGNRIKRGLFKSSDGFKYNADLNGSLNILRKEFPNCFTKGIEGLLVSPISVKI